ncbi:MAG: carboxypeptidase-like regulatory domain-containing protein [Planctomycetota bacterium]|jgi:hypothetical protein
MRSLLVFAFAVASSALTAFTVAPPVIVYDGGTIFIELGERFRGELGADGGTAYATFNAVEGTLVDLDVRARALVLSIALLDASGAEVDLGDAKTEDGKHAEINDFEIPESGNYTFVIGGTPLAFPGQSDKGDFNARTKGDLPPWIVLSTISGAVTNSLTGDAISGAGVFVEPFFLVTDETGAYSGSFPVGPYNVTFEATYFVSHTEPVLLLPAVPVVLDVALDPIAPVVVITNVSGDAVPDGMLEATATVVVLDGSTVGGFSWTQTAGAEADISGAETPTATVHLGASYDYKELLLNVLAEPPIGEDQLPPNVPPPSGEFPGGLQNRFEVVGASPFALEEAGLITLEVEVITTSGAYHGEVEVDTHLPWNPSVGIRNVPIGVAVLLHGKDQAAYDWAMVPPDSSGAVLVDDTTQYPEFIPDIPGIYEITVTDEDGGGQVLLEVYAGTWRGVIVAQDDDGRPLAEPTCVSCHEVFDVELYTPWAQTGHAEIFTNNLNTSTHYGPGCFPCHTVGYDPNADNGGMDDAPDYEDFLNSGLLNNPGDNWTTMLAEFPAAAQLANIQCENCHGPQNAGPGVTNPAHREGDPRASLSSDVCAACHGEPLRHGRFQQWQLSGHADYELAIDEGESGNCSRCHTGNGFLAWVEQGNSGDNVDVTWTSEEVHPQTCATCHDPHRIGTTSGNDNNATVRISGNTPPLLAGFTAYGVGRGALCMTCHNSRRGLRNDATFPDHYQTPEAARSPHGPAQTDVLMGENAYLVTVGFRGNHSFLTDTCANCHMVQTPPPDDLSYNQGGTNHTFYASTEICAECHGLGFDPDVIQSGVQDLLDMLQGLIEEGLLDLIEAQTDLGYVIDLNGEMQITDAADVMEIVFGEFRGRHSMTVTFMSGQTFGPYRMNDIDVIDPNNPDPPLGELYDFAVPNLIKAGWNWLLIHNDGSTGLHNPTYSFNVLAAALEGLDAPPLQAVDWAQWRGNDSSSPGWRQ